MSDRAATAEDEGDQERSQKRSKVLVGGVVAIALAIGGYFALGMPGMDHSATPSSMTGMDHTGAAVGWTKQAVGDFAGTIARADVTTINVHVPDEGSIAGTDLTIPYTDVLTNPSLPTDRTTPLALYCRSGRMSAIAAQALVAAGYTDVVELDGGMNAWTGAGRSLGP